jgi:hypothetical protein
VHGAAGPGRSGTSHPPRLPRRLSAPAPQHIRKSYSLSGRTLLASTPHPLGGAGNSPRAGGGAALHGGRRPVSPLHSHALTDASLTGSGSPGRAGAWPCTAPSWVRHAIPPGRKGRSDPLAGVGSGHGTDGFGSDLDADDSGTLELALEEGDEALEGGLERIPDLELGDEEGGAPRANGGAPGHSGWQDQGPEPGDAVAGSGPGSWPSGAGGMHISPARRRGRRVRMRPSGAGGGSGGGGSAFGAARLLAEEEAEPGGQGGADAPNLAEAEVRPAQGLGEALQAGLMGWWGGAAGGCSGSQRLVLLVEPSRGRRAGGRVSSCTAGRSASLCAASRLERTARAPWPLPAAAQALQSHLSCASLSTVGSPGRRKPLFFPEGERHPRREARRARRRHARGSDPDIRMPPAG